ncbi:MAG: nucleoside-triphosphatase, partial [Gammaproteobacteria bacterium]
EEGYQGPWLEVGRFRFSAEAFRKACDYLLHAGGKTDAKLLLIDEIGPLELRGEGFSEVLKLLLSEPAGPDILLVVRSELVQEVQAYFGLANARVEPVDSFSRNFSLED